jgi:hypothetical protein
MLSLDKLLDRKKEASGLVSAQIRTLALGFIAISWTLLTAHDEPLKTMSSHVNRYFVLFLAASGVLVMAFDLLQYVAVTAMADKAARLAEAAPSEQAQYDSGSIAYKAQAFFFWSKFVILAVGAILLSIVFFHLLTAA